MGSGERKRDEGRERERGMRGERERLHASDENAMQLCGSLPPVPRRERERDTEREREREIGPLWIALTVTNVFFTHLTFCHPSGCQPYAPPL